MTSPDLHTLAGAYALNALDEHESARFRRHLSECHSCRQEVRELQATAARLGEAAALEPPPELKGRVLAEIRATRQVPPAADAEPKRASRDTGVPRWAMLTAAAAAVVGLALAGVFGGLALRAQNQYDAAQQQIEQASGRYAPVSDLLTASDVRVEHAQSTIGGSATVLVSRSREAMMVLGGGLPPAEQGHDYELWLLQPDGEMHSAGVLPPDEMLLANGADGVDTARGMAVTVEQQGGSPTGAPSGAPILRVDMPA
ncbi:anti-sigma factor [Prauserella cavernicola]|uniref:Regulator of SigK n=1 Tax=Prauserella cavernicola TaxID=2800127 RepID=A0A934V919_9PSEU|nr:anti-sigma factor [Prauserella cavernicola]MBK1788383.1 anti-sigma factor [Prauserella cavernicola]